MSLVGLSHVLIINFHLFHTISGHHLSVVRLELAEVLQLLFPRIM